MLLGQLPVTINTLATARNWANFPQWQAMAAQRQVSPFPHAPSLSLPSYPLSLTSLLSLLSHPLSLSLPSYPLSPTLSPSPLTPHPTTLSPSLQHRMPLEEVLHISQSFPAQLLSPLATQVRDPVDRLTVSCHNTHTHLKHNHYCFNYKKKES